MLLHIAHKFLDGRTAEEEDDTSNNRDGTHPHKVGNLSVLAVELCAPARECGTHRQRGPLKRHHVHLIGFGREPSGQRHARG